MDTETIAAKAKAVETVPEVALSSEATEGQLEKIQNARLLVDDPNYPSRETLQKLAEIIYEKCIKDDKEI
jgi:hypothetical protein